MNVFLKKEIRLLLPSFLIGCVLTFSSWLLLWESKDAISSILYLLPFVVCPAVAVMIALDSFGVEVSSGTFTNLLAQPVSRLKIWETKISLLAVALLVVGVLWFGSIFCVRFFFSSLPDDFKDLGDMFVAGAMFALVVFSGGLWTVLLLRQVAAAFWFTLLVPGVIMVILVGLLADHSGEFIEGMAVSVLGLYSLAGFFFARWLFLRAQDVQWSGGVIVMPEMRGLPAWLTKSAALRVLRPRAALWRKEFQLHQSQFIMAFALLLLHIAALVARHFVDNRKSPDIYFVLEIFWGLWLVMPVLVGCAAVAEERKLGTLEGQLCLPVKRRTQFAIKFFVALFLSVLLGVAMPLLLEEARILPNAHFGFGGLQPGWQSQMSTAQLFFWNCLGLLNGILPLLALAGIAAAFGVISFCISSLMRNTLQTLAPAVLGILLAFFGLMVIVQTQEFDLDFLWRGPLPFFIVGPVMLVALLALAFWNFQQVRTGWKMWRRNFFVFAMALAFAVTATSAIYHRAWEKLTPFEPPHGAAKLSRSNTASLNVQWYEISIRLPDGKIWLANFIPGPNAYNPLALLLGNIKVAVDDGGLINGSNWTSVLRSGGGLVGIKNDGSLWVSKKPWRERLQDGKWKINEDEMHQLVPFGNETNWSSFAPAGLSTLLVKNDGTLWRWGVTNFDSKHNQWPGLRAFTPHRLGTNSDWAEVFQNSRNDYQVFLRKADGNLWMSSENWNTNGQTLLEIEPGFIVQSVKNLGRDKFRSVTEISHGLQFKVGVRDNGTFRIWADERVEHPSPSGYGNYEWFPTDLQIGGGTNWVAVAGDGEKIITLKDDGSLWLWNFHLKGRQINWDTDRFAREIQDTRPVRLGTHSDWVAISGGWGNVTALAADGSLWFWPLENAQDMGSRGMGLFGSLFDNGDSRLEPLLDISRKPQLLGNIFSRPD
jgi:ABC-type transport system involved in multi-copper enzyme maturation permease subunit/alpha-tubulin suppressor-like RCC1 family protein